MSDTRTIFIVGPAGSGKSAFTRLLKAALMQRAPLGLWLVAECGDLLIRRLANLRSHAPLAAPADKWIAQIAANKEHYREQLRALGDQLAIDAPARLLSECASNAAIVVGARRRLEVLAYYDVINYGASAAAMAFQGARGRGDEWIFVERPGAGLATDSFDRSFFEEFCNRQAINRGDMDGLQAEAARLAAELLPEASA